MWESERTVLKYSRRSHSPFISSTKFHSVSQHMLMLGPAGEMLAAMVSKRVRLSLCLEELTGGSGMCRNSVLTEQECGRFSHVGRIHSKGINRESQEAEIRGPGAPQRRRDSMWALSEISV